MELLPHPAPFILLGASISLLGLTTIKHRELRTSLLRFQVRMNVLKTNLSQRFAIKCYQLMVGISTILLLWPSLASLFRIVMAKHLNNSIPAYIIDISILGSIGLWIIIIAVFEIFIFSFEGNTKKLDSILSR